MSEIFHIPGQIGCTFFGCLLVQQIKGQCQRIGCLRIGHQAAVWGYKLLGKCFLYLFRKLRVILSLFLMAKKSSGFDLSDATQSGANPFEDNKFKTIAPPGS